MYEYVYNLIFLGTVAVFGCVLKNAYGRSILLHWSVSIKNFNDQRQLFVQCVMNAGHYSCVQLLESNDPYNETTVTYTDCVVHDMSMAESFVEMFEAFSIDEADLCYKQAVQNYPDLIQDTFHQVSFQLECAHE